MVYFEDEMKALEAAEREKRPRWRKNLSLAFKISLYLAFFVFVILTVLSRFGGSSDQLRAGVEQALSEATRKEAKIGKLDYLGFFPTVSIAFTDAIFYVRETKNPVALVGNFKLATGFWDLLTMSRRVNTFELNGLTIQEEVGLGRDLSIKTAALKKPEKGGKAALVVNGEYGIDPLTANVDVDYIDRGNGRPYFMFTSDHAFSARMGDVTLNGRYVFMPDGGLKLELASVDAPTGKIGDGTLTFVSFPDKGLTVKGGIKVGAAGQMALDLIFGKTTSGTVGVTGGDPNAAVLVKALNGFFAGSKAERFALPQGVALTVDGKPVKVETLDEALKALSGL
jgi:hypothetical protein